MCPVLLGRVHGLPIQRAVYMEGCLYVCLSIFLLGLDQLLLLQMVFATDFYVEIITPSTLRDI